MGKQKCTKNVLVISFIILIVFPGLLTVLHLLTGKDLDKTLKGNFDTVSAPVLTVKSILDKSFQGDFENYFHNTFTGRGYMITTYNQIRGSLFGEFQSSCISESLIFEPYIMAHMGINGYDYSLPEKAAEMEKYINKLQSVSDLLEAQGKKLLLVSAPGKAAYFEDSIPYKYSLMPNGLNVSDCFDMLIEKTDILYLDADEYLTDISFSYPVFYKSSHHWSRTAEVEIENKIFAMINEDTQFSADTYEITGITESNIPIDRDADTWDLLNLWIPTDDIYYKYDINAHIAPNPTNICIQGDSYSTLIQSDLIVNGHNGSVSLIDYDNAYYIDNELVTLIEHDFSNLDIKKIINDNDIFIIIYTDYNLSSYAYGFVDALYECMEVE